MDNITFQNFARSRDYHRTTDIAESKTLLLELGMYEPTLQMCIKIIQNTCLSQGIFCKIDGCPPTEAFKDHIMRHYMPFLKVAIQYMLVFGFVPWRARQLPGKNVMVPEILPFGTFDWVTEIGPQQHALEDADYGNRFANGRKYPTYSAYGVHGERKYQNRDAHAMTKENDTRLVVYRVMPRVGNVREEDVNVYTHTPPALNISENSILYASVPSPLAHVLFEYKHLRTAQLRRSYADAWNTTAHVISVFKPKMVNQDDPTQYLMDFVHESHYDRPPLASGGIPGMAPPLEARNWLERDVMIKRMMDRPSTHRPLVYTLPRDHELAKQEMLQPCEDVEFLLLKFKRDLCSVAGIPFEMVAGRESGIVNESKRKTLASGRQFTTNMIEYCRHCETLLQEVYCSIYKKEPETIKFELVPMPRLEIDSIEDFKTLFEIGALTPDVSVNISKLLLGSSIVGSKQDGKDRLMAMDIGQQMHNGTGTWGNGGGSKRSRDQDERGEGSSDNKRPDKGGGGKESSSGFRH